MEQCPICCNPKVEVLSRVRTINPDSNVLVNIIRCAKCGHWSTSPSPTQEELSKMYQENSEFVVPHGYTGTSPSKERDFKQIENLIMNKKSNKINYLEIRCGSGGLLRYMEKWHAQVAYGVDPGCWRDYKNIVPSINALPEELKFNVIVAQDVLEHVENPIQMLSKIRNVSSDDSIIICQFPNSESMLAKLRKGKWRMIRPFGHLHYFSSKSVELSFKTSRWKVVHRSRC